MSIASEIRAWAVASAAVFALSAIGYRVYTAPDLSGPVGRLNAALDTVNRPCKGVSCGTLANIDKLVMKVGDIAVDTQMQVRQTGTLISAASQSLTSTSATLNAQLEHIGPLLDSAKAAADALPVTLQHVNGAVDGVTPVLASIDGATGDFRRFITAPALSSTIANVDSMTVSWSATSDDLRRVADKTTTDYLKPVKWYMWPIKRGSELLDIGAAIARHTP